MTEKSKPAKDGEEFTSEINNETVETEFEKLFSATYWQEIFAQNQSERGEFLAYVRAVMELDEVYDRIEDVRSEKGEKAALVCIDPNGNETISPLQELSVRKMARVLEQFQIVSQKPHQDYPILPGESRGKMTSEALKAPNGDEYARERLVDNPHEEMLRKLYNRMKQRKYDELYDSCPIIIRRFYSSHKIPQSLKMREYLVGIFEELPPQR